MTGIWLVFGLTLCVVGAFVLIVIGDAVHNHNIEVARMLDRQARINDEDDWLAAVGEFQRGRIEAYKDWSRVA